MYTISFNISTSMQCMLSLSLVYMLISYKDMHMHTHLVQLPTKAISRPLTSWWLVTSYLRSDACGAASPMPRGVPSSRPCAAGGKTQ